MTDRPNVWCDYGPRASGVGSQAAQVMERSEMGSGVPGRTKKIVNPRTNRLCTVLTKTAHRWHQCERCVTGIPPGAKYGFVTAFYPARLCVRCVDVMVVEADDD